MGRFSDECCKTKPKPISNHLNYSANLIFDEFENVQQSSEMFRKCLETIVWPSDNFWRTFGNLRKIVENVAISVFIK